MNKQIRSSHIINAALLFLLGCAEAGPADPASSANGDAIEERSGSELGKHEEALSIYTDNQVGNLVVVTPASGPDVPNRPGRWTDVPGLSTAVFARAGDSFAMKVSAEISTTDKVWLRALIDGVAAQPNDVVFKMGGTNFDGVRSFTFVAANQTAGRHIVSIQWLTGAGINATIGDRTLTVNSASPTFGTGRLVTSSAETDWVTNTSAAWQDVPGLAQTLTLPATSDLKLTFSAQTSVDSGRLFMRATVDGVGTGDTVMESAGELSRGGVRSYSFVRPAVGAGTHAIRVQWRADTGQVKVADRTFTTSSSPSSTAGGGFVLSQWEGAGTPFTSASGWTNIPNASGTFVTTDPSSVAELEFSAEHMSNGGAWLRALVDGQTTGPDDVLFTQNSGIRAQSYSFQKKNILPGSHSVQFQILAGSGVTATIFDRAFSVTFKRRHGVDFAQPYAGLKPRVGSFRSIVICFDPGRVGITRPAASYIRGMFNGEDGGPSLLGWFQENTLNHYTPQGITFLGCSDGGWFPAPPGRGGSFYWDNFAWDLMYQDAMKAADSAIDFHSLDLDGDGYIEGDEASIAIIRPETGPGGDFRSSSVAVDGISTPMGFDLVDAYIAADTSDATRRWNVGLLAHETSHGVIGAYDMYSGYTTDADFYSVMSAHFRATFLDPAEALKSGFVTPDVIEINGLTTRTFSAAAREATGEITIVYDPVMKDREYFVLENRWSANNTNFDRGLPDQGLAVWHIVQDQGIMDAFPPPLAPMAPADPGSAGYFGRRGIRFLGVLKAKDQSIDLTYASGTKANARVTVNSGPAASLSVTVNRVGNSSTLAFNGFEGAQASTWWTEGIGGVDPNASLAFTGVNYGWIRASSGWNSIMTTFATPTSSRCWISLATRSSGNVTDIHSTIFSGANAIADVGPLTSADIQGITPSLYGRLPPISFLTGSTTVVVFRTGFFGNGQDAWLRVDDAQMTCEPI